MPKRAATALADVVSLARRRGFAYPSGEVYGATRAAWDLGPLGVELRDNLRRQWWRAVVHGRDDVVGLDASIILPPATWVASGHEDGFADPLTECRSCRQRFRVDHLRDGETGDDDGRPADLVSAVCPSCGTRGAWTEPRRFSGLLTTHVGAAEGDEGEGGRHHLRPEAAQGVFLNLANVVTTSRSKPPFGIAQVATCFRNEITPGDFLFRTREFEQMSLAWFVKPGEGPRWHTYWLEERTRWYVDLGIDPDDLRHHEHPRPGPGEHTTHTVDIDFRFGLPGSEWGALEGVTDRADHDLRAHAEASGRDLSFFDQAAGERWLPHVVEPAAGLSRAVMAFLVAAHATDEAPNTKGGVDQRTVLRLDPRLAPVKAAVLPLSRNAELSPRARALATELRASWPVEFDDAGAIGKRYRRQDEIGTPYCVTVDFETLDDEAVTVRERDTMQQTRVPLAGVADLLAQKLRGC
ncbi:glycine--tRNA ligase [Nocardioides litoris]|uniref:glycine--tRNA ligase n=1 Tax=Nocardioides litoris TaxID=1926648 RepID=UPI001123E7A7|nr:glycine--tRNA ligase [Nocardioides litoris]